MLTFEYLPAGDTRVNAVAVEVPGVDRVRFHDVLLTDPAARAALSGDR